MFYLRSLVVLLSLLIVTFPTNSIANDILPDDIRYMLEDLYGANKSKWPSLRNKLDINKDGYIDWVVKKKGCKLKESCTVEIFICIPNNKGMCSEYCYVELNTLDNVMEQLQTRKCDSTC